MTERLEGKVALISGASRGIGRAIALAFGREGAGVVVNYAVRGDAADEVGAAITADGGRALAVQANVARRDEVGAMQTRAVERFGQVDLLVINAGISRSGDTLTMTEAVLDELIDVNLKGVINCVQAFVPGMIERRSGRIVNIASIAGIGTALPDTTPYAATKAAVIGLTWR